MTDAIIRGTAMHKLLEAGVGARVQLHHEISIPIDGDHSYLLPVEAKGMVVGVLNDALKFPFEVRLDSPIKVEGEDIGRQRFCFSASELTLVED